MPDIDPAALSRTPIVPTKSITVSAPSAPKPAKVSYNIAPRIDLEPIYTALKQAIPSDQWATYKEATAQFIIGRLNQAEYSERVDPILYSYNGEREHLHNQLIAAIYGNLTREIPDQGLAPWVSAQDKPTTGAGSKPVTGDAAERRLKGEVMQLPPKDRRRIKDLAHNDFDPYDAMANVFFDPWRSRHVKGQDAAPASAAGISSMNVDIEVRKRFAQPLAVESGEFPDQASIEARMLPFCYEFGLSSGHAPDAAQFLLTATDTFVKEVLSSIFNRTRSNGPGDSGSAGFGSAGASWIQTYRYRRQLVREEEALMRGEVQRDKSGLLPVEAKAASERGPLGLADFRIALEMAESGLATFPTISRSILYGYREGELEEWDDYTYFDDRPRGTSQSGDVEMSGVNGIKDTTALPNGVGSDAMDVDPPEILWEGAEPENMAALDNLLDNCLSLGS